MFVYSLKVVDVVFSHNGGAALTLNHPAPIVGNNSVPIAPSIGKTSSFEKQEQLHPTAKETRMPEAVNGTFLLLT